MTGKRHALNRWTAYGAIRHAITVGFISMMILGVLSRVVPTLRNIPQAGLPALWLPYALLNLGCAMRALFQTLTDFSPAFFPFAGVSGILEVSALALWGAHLWRLLDRPTVASLPSQVTTATAAGAPALSR